MTRNRVNTYTRSLRCEAGVFAALVKAQCSPAQSKSSRHIKSTDAEIDRLVYELYGLTEEAIRIVEDATK